MVRLCVWIFFSAFARCESVRSAGARDGVHAVEYIAPVPSVFATPAPVVDYMTPPQVEYIAPAPAVIAAPAFVVQYITTEPALSYVAAAPTVYAAPAPVVEYGRGGVLSARACRVRDTSSFVPAPAVSYVATAVYATPAPEMEYIAPARAVIVAPAPAVYAAPASAVSCVASAPAVYAVPALVVEYIAQAPAVSYVAPAVHHSAWQRVTPFYVLCLPSERGMGMRMNLADTVPSGKYSGMCVFTAPFAEPTAMSFTVPWTRSTIVATAAVVTTCSASAGCTDSATPMYSGCVCVAMSCGGGSFSPNGAYVSLQDSVKLMTGKCINYCQYQEDVGCVCRLNDWISSNDEICLDSYNYFRFSS